MHPSHLDLARYLPRGPHDQCSPCEQLAELICAIPGMLRAWRRRARDRAQLRRLGRRELRDIGIFPGEVARECVKPFWRG